MTYGQKRSSIARSLRAYVVPPCLAAETFRPLPRSIPQDLYGIAVGYVISSPRTRANGVSLCACRRFAPTISQTATPRTSNASAISERWQRHGTASAHMMVCSNAIKPSIANECPTAKMAPSTHSVCCGEGSLLFEVCVPLDSRLSVVYPATSRDEVQTTVTKRRRPTRVTRSPCHSIVMQCDRHIRGEVV
jgi:hypothetical protein